MPLRDFESHATVEQAEAAFADNVLMCGKCTRKLGSDGKALRKSLKHALKKSCWAKVRLIKAGCFSLCPKGGQVLVTVRKLGDRRLLVVEPGFAIENALNYLLGRTCDLQENANDREP